MMGVKEKGDLFLLSVGDGWEKEMSWGCNTGSSFKSGLEPENK